jgi:hypothetical protein
MEGWCMVFVFYVHPSGDRKDIYIMIMFIKPPLKARFLEREFLLKYLAF